jgi:DNA-binding SARP family transcriptional activator
VSTLPPSLSTAVGPSCGPVSDADPLGRSEQLGSLVAHELDVALHRPIVLVLDELERLAGDASATRFVEALVRNAPAQLSIVLVSRDDVPFSVTRLRADDQLDEIGPADLRLDQRAGARVVAERWPWIADLGPAVVTATDGQPGAMLAVAALLARTDDDERASLLDEIGRSASPLLDALRRSSERLDEPARAVLEDLVVLRQASVGELGRLGHVDAAKAVHELVDLALVEVDDHARPTRGADEIVAPSPERRATRAVDAVRLAVGRGDPGAGIAAAHDHGDHELLRSTLATYGAAAITDGHGRLVLDAIDHLGDEPSLAGLAGRAAQALGDWRSAAAAYRRAAGHAVRAADAWRHGLIEYLQGDTTEALAIYERALAAPHPSDAGAGADADRAMLHGYAGAASWQTGDVERARHHAHESLALATAGRDDAAIAVAHTLAAMVAASDGDRVANDWHYVQALQHAERAGDALQVARIRSNRGSKLKEEGEYEAALLELDDAVRAADLGGYGAVLALALSNRGEALTRLGRLDDARTDFVAAIDLLQRQGSRMVAYPLVGLAQVFVARGDLEQARSACERALAMSERAADRQIAVAAHVQLARAVAERDPDVARTHADAAVAADSLDAAEAWSVVGLLAVGRGDPDAGIAAATTAGELARARRDRFALAHALEVAALCDPDTAARRVRLEEALHLFDELGCPLDAGRVEVRLVAERLDTYGVTRVAEIADLARRSGARPLLARAEEVVRRHDDAARDELVVTVLGSFGLQRRGEAVPVTAWQSKKARDLFKMLVVLRGRPLPREEAIERLWPGEDPAKVSGKLSVALATIRSVLDPDKRHPPDRYLRADGDAILVDDTAAPSDVDRFLQRADLALREHRRAPGQRAVALLVAAEAAYTGDVLEDDPYVDWYVPLREEARAVYLGVTRTLARVRSDAGDHDDAIRLLLRVLEREPYDEPAHLELVAALTRVGRHGDARRRYQHYAVRMRELDIEPRSFPVA